MSIHQPVMLQEVLAAWAIDPNGIYIDGTFGRGGHSHALLEQIGEGGRILACDRDPAACAFGERLAQRDARFEMIHQNYADIAKECARRDWMNQVSGVLLDLGVSSPQLDEAERGFSFLRDGPLDMRMDPTQGESAADWLNRVTEQELASVIYQWGEEPHSRRIAKAIVQARIQSPLERTAQLAAVIVAALPPVFSGQKHPATRTFQAIRLWVNQELTALNDCLASMTPILKQGGRLVVISFHSLEDRMVKQWMRQEAKGEDFPLGVPLRGRPVGRFRLVGGLQRPAAEEVKQNPRARSARLRVAERIAPS